VPVVNARPTVPLLRLDPRLGQLLPQHRLSEAHSALTVRVARLRQGEWDLERAAGNGSTDHLGVLVLDGIVAHDVVMGSSTSTELLGPGDLLRPWTREAQPLLQRTVRWYVLTDSRVALLDREFARQLGAWPEVNAMLMDRLSQRAERLATAQAIAKLTRVERRVLAFLWHLAERWGRPTTGGVLVPLTLSHRMLGQIVGARRPTVTAAVRLLVESGEVVRPDDGSWLLTGDRHQAQFDDEPARVVAPRRRLVVGRESRAGAKCNVTNEEPARGP
jgi:CRP/FNR family transcriptional regulator, cyclic AMP receptor protein